MRGERDGIEHPGPAKRHRRRLLGQFPERAFSGRHDLARGPHLRLEIGIARRQLDPARRDHQGQLLPRRSAEMREHLLGQDDTGGIADFGDFERSVHTGVITSRGCSGNDRLLGARKARRQRLSGRSLALHLTGECRSRKL